MTSQHIKTGLRILFLFSGIVGCVAATTLPPGRLLIGVAFCAGFSLASFMWTGNERQRSGYQPRGGGDNPSAPTTGSGVWIAPNTLQSRAWCSRDLKLVAPAPPPDDPPLIAGDYCRLNSGGPASLVVDASDEAVTVAAILCRLSDGNHGISAEEYTFPRACMRRVNLPEEWAR